MKQAFKVIPNKIDKTILLQPEKSYFSLIWLHGLGDSSAGFLDYFQQKSSPLYKGGRIKLLQAPLRRVTINGGQKYNSWYDIRSLSGYGTQEQRFNLQQITDSLLIIQKNVVEELAYWKQSGIKQTDQNIYKRIFIGGFSQGCAMSLCYGLNSLHLLGGIIGYSGHIFESLSMMNKDKIPMLVYHGGQDDVLNYKWIKPTYEKHLKPHKNFNFKLIPNLSHSVTEQQLSESTQFILEQLKQYQITP